MYTFPKIKTKALCQTAHCWGQFLPGGFSSQGQELKSGNFISHHRNHIQLRMQISVLKACSKLRHISAQFSDFWEATIFFTPGVTTWAVPLNIFRNMCIYFICTCFLGNFCHIWNRISLESQVTYLPYKEK